MYPPRPEKAIAPDLINFYEKLGWIAQIKMNGTCQIITVHVNGVSYQTRHNQPNKAWSPPLEISNYFMDFPNSIFVGELLHNKHPSVKNKIILFDVLRYLDENLIGMTLYNRLAILRNIEDLDVKNVEIVKSYDKNLNSLFYSLSSPLEEGIVLKDPNATLRDWRRPGLNTNWQVKCRRATKNYAF